MALKQTAEFDECVGSLSAAVELVDQPKGFRDGYEYGVVGRPVDDYHLQQEAVDDEYDRACAKYDTLTFSFLQQISALAGEPDLEALRALLASAEAAAQGGEAGTSGTTPPSPGGEDGDDEEQLDYGEDDE